MKRIGLVVAYDGTNYSGWQIQPNGVTIQGVLNTVRASWREDRNDRCKPYRRRGSCHGKCGSI
mgnify:CR=1 FL=1